MVTLNFKLQDGLTLPLALAFAALGAVPSLAQVSSLPGVTSVTGQTTMINPPFNITLQPVGGNPPLESDVTAFLWLEQEAYTLGTPVDADIAIPGFYNSQASLVGANGTIAPGTLVNSYYLYTNAVGAPPLSPNNPTYAGTINFDQEILGILTTTTTIINSSQLQAPGTIYPLGTDPGLGVTLSPIRDQVNLSADRKQLGFFFTTGPGADNLRVITKAPTASVPEPSNLLALGLLGLGTFFKRQVNQNKKTINL